MKSGTSETKRENGIPASSLKSGDVIAVLVIIAAAAGLIFFFGAGINSGEGSPEKYAEISVYAGEGKSVYMYPLDRDEIIEFESLGFRFTAEISNGKISIIRSECPDGICAGTPAVSSEREAVICVPAKMIIKIVSDPNGKSLPQGKSNGEDCDYVAY